MLTIVTHVTIEPGEGPRWDAVSRERVAAARQQPGRVGVQRRIPAQTRNKRVGIGTWEARAAGEGWHEVTFDAHRQRGEITSGPRCPSGSRSAEAPGDDQEWGRAERRYRATIQPPWGACSPHG